MRFYTAYRRLCTTQGRLCTTQPGHLHSLAELIQHSIHDGIRNCNTRRYNMPLHNANTTRMSGMHDLSAASSCNISVGDTFTLANRERESHGITTSPLAIPYVGTAEAQWIAADTRPPQCELVSHLTSYVCRSQGRDSLSTMSLQRFQPSYTHSIRVKRYAANPDTTLPRR